MIQKIIQKTLGAALNLLSFFFPNWATNLAISLFSTPRKKEIREKELAFLNTADQIKRSVGDLPIVEYHWGDPTQPRVILSYGWEYNAGRWRYYVPALVKAGYSVLAYDPTGHGLAPKGQMNIPRNALIIKDLIEKYGRPEVIIAHSFGGGSALFALHQLAEWRHPKRMVVMASFSYAPRIFKEFAKALSIVDRLYYRVVRTFEQRTGRRLEEFDFAQMTSAMPHISGMIIHSPSDEITPYSESRRYFDFWENAALLSPVAGGHHLGTPETTKAILEFAINGNLPENVEIQEFPITGKHELVRYFPGM
jgi:pimeloyl-ACP methyl ester carboxylesterase